MQAVQPFQPQVLQEAPHKQVTQEPIVQQVQLPVIPPHLQAPISTVQHRPQSGKRQLLLQVEVINQPLLTPTIA